MAGQKSFNLFGLNPTKLETTFENNNVYFTREMRISVLKKVIEPRYIKEIQELEKIRDENTNTMSIKESIRLNRIKNYSILSEFQLENDYIYYEDTDIVVEYLALFWDEMTKHIQTLPNAETIFKEIEELGKEDYTIKSVCDYNRFLHSRVLDESDYFDGIHLVDAVDHFNKTSTATEIQKLSQKYHLSIPKYYKKEDLQKRLKKYFKSQNTLTPEMTERINTSSVKKLQELLDENGIDSKLHITKTDMIDLIIKSVDKNKVSLVAQQVEEVIEDEPVVEPVAEPVKEEIVEETIEEKETVVPLTSNAPFDAATCSRCSSYFKTVMANQEILIEQNERLLKERQNPSSYKFSKSFNIIIIMLIAVLIIVWVFYGVTNLF